MSPRRVNTYVRITSNVGQRASELDIVMAGVDHTVKEVCSALGYPSLKEKQLILRVNLVSDVTYDDAICIPRGQADATLFTRPFLDFFIGGSGLRD